jgi:hypothetical protein
VSLPSTFPLKGHRDAGEVRAERDDLEPLGWFAGEAQNRLIRVSTIVRDQGLLVAGIEFAQLGNGAGC